MHKFWYTLIGALALVTCCSSLPAHAQGKSHRKDRPPSVSITSPATGTTYTAPGTVAITVVAGDDRGLATVTLSDWGRVVQTAPSSFTYAWTFAFEDNSIHSWTAKATDTSGQSKSSNIVNLTVDISPTPGPDPNPPPTSTVVGATLDIICPVDGSARVITVGEDPAPVTDSGSLPYCFKQGTHYPSRPIQGRQGMVLYGEKGAILDGRDVVQDWDIGSVGVIRAHNCSNCSNGVVRNLIVQNAPLTGVACPTCGGAGLHWGMGLMIGAGANDWLIDHVETRGNPQNINVGMNFRSKLTFVYSHDPSYDCSIEGYQPKYLTIEDSVFLGSKNHECKFADSGDMVVRRSTFGQPADGGATFWLDTSGYYSPHTCHLLEDNVFIGGTDWPAIDIEAVHCAVIKGGSLTMQPTAVAGGLFIPNSTHITVDGMTFNQPVGGGGVVAAFFYDGRPVDFPVSDNVIRNSTFNLSAAGARVGFQCTGLSEADCQAYLLSHNNTYENNTYKVPDIFRSYWYAGAGSLTWAQWQGLGQDLNGSVTVR